MTLRTKKGNILKISAALLGLCLAVLLILSLLPMKEQFCAPLMPPPASYQESRAALEKLFADVPSTLSEAGHPRAYLHEQPTDQVFVFLHGLTSAPEQFELLARQLYARGHNVVLVRSPGHGESDTMTDQLANLTAQGMLDAANQAVNLAHGLGHHVTLVGLSINGPTAAWFAQNRPDVDRTVLLAPFFAPKGIPLGAIAPLANLVVRLPNAFLWWDPRVKQNMIRPTYSYPRYSTHSIGKMMLLGLDVLKAARQTPLASRSILIVTTASDFAVNNAITARLAERWRKFRPEGVKSYEFSREERVPHDFIDPHQTNQRIAIVYPRLIEMLETGVTPSGK